MRISAIKVSELEGRKRLDAEYYQPHHLEMVKRFEKFKSLNDYKPLVLHPTEVKRVYEEEGLQLLFTQNIRDNRLDFSHTAYLSFGVEEQIRKNKLQPGDIVVTRTGANFGDAAPYDGSPSPIYASSHCIIIRCKDIPGSYLSTYFNTNVGKALLKRGVYGAAQPEIAPDYIRTLQIPRFGEKTEKLVEQKLKQAKQKRDTSEQLYADAENLLASELGLDKPDLSESLFNIRNVSDVINSARMDAEYFQRKYDVLEDKLAVFPQVTVKKLVKYPVSSGSTPLAGGSDYTDEIAGISFIRAVNLSGGEVQLDDVIYVKKEVHEKTLKKTKLHEGDVLFSIAGTVGRCALYTHAIEANINQALSILRFDETVLKRLYVVAFFNSPIGKEYVSRYGRLGLQTNLNLEEVSNLKIPAIKYKAQEQIADKIQLSFDTRQEAKRLLAEAKEEVEKMIEGK